MSCYNSTVPSSPPQNVMATSVNRASLMVLWQPLPMIDHNGPITYMIQYTRVGSSDMMSVNVNSGTTQYTISGLVAYVNYSVIVTARTVNGTGPFSNRVVGRSGEDGELNNLLRSCMHAFYILTSKYAIISAMIIICNMGRSRNL